MKSAIFVAVVATLLAPALAAKPKLNQYRNIDDW